MRLFSSFLLLLVAAGWSQPGYVSPLMGSLSTHDPVLIKQDSVYYVFHTGNGVQIKTSPDRINWSNGNPSSVFQSIPSWHTRFRNTLDSWAPAISFWDGKYWLYYSVSNFGSRRSAIGLRTNTTLRQNDPAYNWVDAGVVVCTYDNASTHPDCFQAPTTLVNGTDTSAFNAIDPAVILDGAGIPWLAWGSFGAGVQMIRLNRQTGKPDSGAKPVTLAHRYVTNSPSGSDYARSIEGPVMSRHGAWYYLWYSHDRCCAAASSTYRIKVARSISLAGPYADKAGILAHPPYRAGGVTTGNWQTADGGTLVSKGDSINWAATGHSDIFTERDTVFLVNHGYTQSGGQTRLMIRPLYWDAQGWPTLISTEGTIKFPTTVSVRAPKAHRAPVKAVWKNGVLVPWRDQNWNTSGRAVKTGIPPSPK